jgi:hypothetical protein
MPQVSDPAGNVAIARANVSGHPQASFWTLTLGAIGVVYGDIERIKNRSTISGRFRSSQRLPLMLPKKLPSGLVGGFEPIACHVATTVYSGTAEIDVVAVACAA